MSIDKDLLLRVTLLQFRVLSRERVGQIRLVVFVGVTHSVTQNGACRLGCPVEFLVQINAN